MTVAKQNLFAGFFCMFLLSIGQASSLKAAETTDLTGRYFMIVWSYQGPDGDLVHAHTFASFYLGDDLAKGVVRPETISWLPATAVVQPFGSEKGHNFSLTKTLQMACSAGRQIHSWGPYEIDATLFDSAIKRLALLYSGRVRYSMINALPRSMNCITAAGDLTGAPLDTGILWGNAASAKVVEHFSPHILGKAFALKDLIARSRSDACPGQPAEISPQAANTSIKQSIAATLGH
ncbi:MAG: hypothetical protein JSR78_19920 [Proteobacteria bacterium]|nr:hypothetical protein [Pseudomonadota bacterium]